MYYLFGLPREEGEGVKRRKSESVVLLRQAAKEGKTGKGILSLVRHHRSGTKVGREKGRRGNPSALALPSC